MSSPPSAFDALMSGARKAAASKKKSENNNNTPSSSSPRKRKKTLDQSPPISENPNSVPLESNSKVELATQNNELQNPAVKKSKSDGGNVGDFVANSKKKPADLENPNSTPQESSSIVEPAIQKNELQNPAVKKAKSDGANVGEFVANSKKKPADSENLNSTPQGSNSIVKPATQKNELRNPFAKKAKVSINVDEFVANLKKKPANFDPNLAAWWEGGEKVPFLFLAKAFDLIKGESGRIVITDITCNLLRTVIAKTPEDLLEVVYLLANKIAPGHQGLELGIGDASLIKALAEACGATETVVKKLYKDLGDLGDVAKEIRSKQSMMRQPPPLTINKVFSTFLLIAQASGKDSQERKKNYIKSLLVAAKDCEPVYLMRLLQAKLRISLAEKTLLVALGQAAVYSEEHSKPPSNIQSPLEEAGKIVKQVYSVIPVYDKIIPALLSDGVWNLSKTCNFAPGIPIGPMLAKPTNGVSEIIDKFQDMVFTCEYKYDGERAQIHFMEDGSVEIYSRNAERNTGKYPDVVAALPRFKKPSVHSFVLDCEIVAYDREKQKILPFQILSTRARKNVAISDIKVEVCVFAFDLLYLNGEALLQEQLNVRRKHLYGSFEEEPGFFQLATTLESNDLEEIQKFLDAAVNASCEGLIIKTLEKEATYEPSKRSNNWLKLKKDYMDSVGDSLDLVPIGAFHGRGKRTGVYGAFLLACYDSNNEEFQTICKIGTGFSEVVLEERSSSLRSQVIPNPKSYYRYGDTLKPDVWFEPSEVWEVKAADLTISPVHRAAVGEVDSDKGISLRFPRLLRIREDKAPEDATSSDQVAEMYRSQANNPHRKSKNDLEEED
ncbi:DNA ligase 1 [Beta vulgaris subsp. vulgaris]|uniref:DNA ligase 1 n=1 Tax=Beta vulgaris subsp. vulgaris TaxID=3555 RepID=UPI002549894C|nr:DNA ligase 1 [Beta vulgaris subsp. vulgaris]